MMLTTLASITRIIRLNSNNIRPAFNPHRPHCCCCRCSSSSSSPSLATAGSSNAQKKENNNPAPGCLRIGILSLPSSLPDVINQFESYLLSELQHKYSPQVQVIRIPHQRDQHKDGTGDHVSHDADDGDDVIRGLCKDDEVPYVICLDENLLDRGIVKLWNRETTLKEEVHSSRILQEITLYSNFMQRQQQKRQQQEQEDASSQNTTSLQPSSSPMPDL